MPDPRAEKPSAWYPAMQIGERMDAYARRLREECSRLHAENSQDIAEKNAAIVSAYRAGQEEMRGRACMIEGPLRSALLRCIAEIETLLAPTPKGLGGMRREYLAKLKGSALGGIGEGKAAIQGEEITALEIKESPNE